MDKKLNVLISAYSCNPYQGSEPGCGWGYIKALSRYHNLYVITESRSKNDIVNYINLNKDLQSINFIYIERKRFLFLEKIWPPSYYWTYRIWQKKAFLIAKNLIADVNFDIVHQLTMTGFREPGYLWKLKIPFVWGPVGGMGLFPWKFLSIVNFHGFCYYFSYNLINIIHMNFLTRPKIAANIAAFNGEYGLITATKENQLGAMKYWGCKSVILSEVGLPPLVMADASAGLTTNKISEFEILWSGRHTTGKALNLALYCVAKLPPEINWKLVILGNGPLTNSMKILSKKLGVFDRCLFYGQLKRDQAISIMAGTQMMLVTSLRDLTSTVIVEGIAQGLPIVCLDHCGFSDVVDDSCGIKIRVDNPKNVITNLSNAIIMIANNMDLRVKLSEGAIVRANDYEWDKKVQIINRVYFNKINKIKYV